METCWRFSHKEDDEVIHGRASEAQESSEDSKDKKAPDIFLLRNSSCASSGLRPRISFLDKAITLQLRFFHLCFVVEKRLRRTSELWCITQSLEDATNTCLTLKFGHSLECSRLGGASIVNTNIQHDL